jgi:hypothetical protein
LLFLCLPLLSLFVLLSLVRFHLHKPTIGDHGLLVSSALPQKSLLYVLAVVSSVRNVLVHLKGLSKAWADELTASGAKLVYFVGRDSARIEELLRLVHDLSFVQVVRLDVDDDQYPPLEKTIQMLNYLSNLDSYPFVVVSDSDTYVHPSRIETIIKGRNAMIPVYLGRPLHHCRCALRFIEDSQCSAAEGIEYCSGSGYILSKGTLVAMQGKWVGCLANFKVATNNCPSSDTLIGYCLGKTGIRPGPAAPPESDFSSFPFHGRSWGIPDHRGVKTTFRTTFCQDRNHEGGVRQIGNMGKTYSFRESDFNHCALFHPLKNPEHLRYVRYMISKTHEAPLIQNQNETCKVLIGVFSVKQNFEIHQIIRSTWKQVADAIGQIKIVFVFGHNGTVLSPHQERSFELEREMYRDAVVLDVEERYDNLYNKSIAWLKYASSHFDCEYVMKVDEDTYLRPPPLLNFLSSISSRTGSLKYFGHQWGNQWKKSSVIRDPTNLWYMYDQYPHDELPYYMSGPCWGMSKELASKVAVESMTHVSYRCEDAGVGILVDSLIKNQGISVEYTAPENFFKQNICTLDTVFDSPHFSIGFNFYQRYFDDVQGDFCAHVKRGMPLAGKHLSRDENVFQWPIVQVESRTRNVFEDHRLLSSKTSWVQVEGKTSYSKFSTRSSISDDAVSWFEDLSSRVSNEENCDSFFEPIGLWIEEAFAVEVNTLGAFRCFQTNTLILANMKRTAASQELFLESHRVPDKISIVVPLSCKSETLQKFLDTTGTTFAGLSAFNSKSIVFSQHACLQDPAEDVKIDEILRLFAHQFPSASLQIVKPAGLFLRANSLNAGITSLSNDTLVIILDVDMIVAANFFYRCAAIVVSGKSVYFPIVFSKYDPENILLSRSKLSRDHAFDDFFVHPDTGVWRSYGYGIQAAFVSDFRLIGGYDESFQAWGGEDDMLWKRFSESALHVLRAPDNSIVHRYHPKDCESLVGVVDQDLFLKCLGSKYTTEGTAFQLGRRVHSLLRNGSRCAQ